jgi:hypothetical protein
MTTTFPPLTTRTAVTLSYDSGTSDLPSSGAHWLDPTAMSPAAIAGLHLDRSTLRRTT